MGKRLPGMIERPESLQEIVYGYLKEQIIEGQLMPGDRLVESHLASQLQVSRTPVHEALVQLEQEGFVVSRPGGGYVTGPLSPRDVREIWDLRRILEVHVLRETVGSFSPEELNDLDSLLLAGDEALQNQDQRAFLEANKAFHDAFSRKYGNARILGVLSNLAHHTRRVLSVGFRSHETVLRTSHTEHKRILEAVRAEAAESAAALLEQHLTGFVDVILSEETAFDGEDAELSVGS